MTDSDGILTVFESVLSKVYHPALHAYTNWGDLNTTQQGRKTVQQFLDNTEGFITYLISKYEKAWITKINNEKNVYIKLHTSSSVSRIIFLYKRFEKIYW